MIELLLLCQQKVVYNLLDHPVRPMENICCSMGEDSNGPISNLSLNTRLTHPFPFPNPYSLPDFRALPHLGLGFCRRQRALLRHRRPGHQLRSLLRLQTLMM